MNIPLCNGADPFKGVLVLPVEIERWNDRVLYGAARHGTTAGAEQHRRDGTEVCGPCLEARRRYNRQWAASKRELALISPAEDQT